MSYTEKQLGKLDAACAKAQGWLPPDHTRTQKLIEACYAAGCAVDLSDQWRSPSEGKLDTPPEYTRDANAAAELMDAMGDGFELRRVWGPMWLARYAGARDWERADRMCEVATQCFLRFKGLNPGKVANGES